jgi:hypothetical protein
MAYSHTHLFLAVIYCHMYISLPYTYPIWLHHDQMNVAHHQIDRSSDQVLILFTWLLELQKTTVRVLASCVYCVAWGASILRHNTWDAGLFIALHACTGRDRCCHYIATTCAEYIGGALWHRGSHIASLQQQHWPSPYYYLACILWHQELKKSMA